MWNISQNWSNGEKHFGEGISEATALELLHWDSSFLEKIRWAWLGSHALQWPDVDTQRKTEVFLSEKGRRHWAGKSSRRVLHPKHIETCWHHDQTKTRQDHPVDAVQLGRVPASLLAGGLLYWKIPVSWWERQPVGNVTLGCELSTSAAMWFSKHESFFSKLWIPGCGTTCYQTQASPGYFNPQIVPTQTPVMECNLIRCDGWEEMLPGCDLISCWLSPIHCPFAFLLQIQFVPINPRETFFSLKRIFENEFIVETES